MESNVEKTAPQLTPEQFARIKKIAEKQAHKPKQVMCVLCHRPLGIKGSSPAIIIDVYDPKTKQKGKARAHKACARQKVGLK